MVLDERHAEADYAGELTRAVALLEQSGSPADLARVAGLLAAALDAPGRDECGAPSRNGCGCCTSACDAWTSRRRRRRN